MKSTFGPDADFHRPLVLYVLCLLPFLPALDSL